MERYNWSDIRRLKVESDQLLTEKYLYYIDHGLLRGMDGFLYRFNEALMPSVYYGMTIYCVRKYRTIPFDVVEVELKSDFDDIIEEEDSIKESESGNV